MINSFLVTLHNSATQPVNPSSLTGDVEWPANYLPKAYTGQAAVANSVLFDGEADPLKHFLTAIQLLWVVQESVLADSVVADDTRISYTETQLLGQFEDVVYDRQQVTRVLSQFDQLRGTDFLTGELAEIYRSSLSRMDQLAAVITYFGLRDNG